MSLLTDSTEHLMSVGVNLSLFFPLSQEMVPHDADSCHSELLPANRGLSLLPRTPTHTEIHTQEHPYNTDTHTQTHTRRHRQTPSSTLAPQLAFVPGRNAGRAGCYRTVAGSFPPQLITHAGCSLRRRGRESPPCDGVIGNIWLFMESSEALSHWHCVTHGGGKCLGIHAVANPFNRHSAWHWIPLRFYCVHIMWGNKMSLSCNVLHLRCGCSVAAFKS